MTTSAPPPPAGFLAGIEPDDLAGEMYAEDLADLGYVMNLSRVWAYDATALRDLMDISRRVAGGAGLSLRHRLLIVLAASAVRESSYCIYAWGSRFADEVPAESAAAVVAGDPHPMGLTAAETALVAWARRVALRPHTTDGADVGSLRQAGWTDAQIFAITVFTSIRMAFATVNDALGALPDADLADRVPSPVRAAVRFGRPPASDPR